MRSVAESPLPLANLDAARALVRALAEQGVRHACVTPGSRSTPLTLALASQTAIKPWLHLDERSSAFFALGLARATNVPVMLVCTSGTAAANYHPAVAEANLSRVPLVVCTADRPPLLRDVGAAQTIAQAGMFGSNVRWALDLPVPFGQPGEEAHFRAFGMRAARMAMAPLPGPVHLNCPFEEPLSGSPLTIDTRPAGGAQLPAPPPPIAAEVMRAANVLAQAERPLIVAGAETGGLPPGEVTALAAKLGAPVLADPLSGLRMGAHDRSLVLDSFDAVLRDRRSSSWKPDVIVRLGGVLTSKAGNQYLARQTEAEHILVEAWGGWRDPDAVTNLVVAGDPAAVCAQLAAALPPRPAGAWADDWLDRDRRASAAMQAATAGFEAPFEGRVFTELQAALPDGATVFVGNSMPVRDADSFLVSCARALSVVSNRGANGIDGVTSSALGEAAAGKGPVVLVIGDLSFYHDLNGLWAATKHGLDLTVVLVNNDGGGIFHYLPQANDAVNFETWFGTPHGIDFAGVIQTYRGRHTVVEGWAAFRQAISPLRSGLNVIELRTERAANVAMHKQAWAAAATAAWGAS